jgi:hypothetical protein
MIGASVLCVLAEAQEAARDELSINLALAA